jgi:hypothetical protein
MRAVFAAGEGIASRREIQNAGGVKCLLSILVLGTGVFAQEAPKASPSDLAPPLRRFDRDRDGKLNAAEMKAARQAHNRGGREAEPNPRRWKEQLVRREREFTREREKDFDADGNGELNDPERKGLREVWQRVAAELTTLRVAITEKYDRNDDGELNDQERNASRQESDRQRREIEERCLREWREKKEAAEKEASEKKDEKDAEPTGKS